MPRIAFAANRQIGQEALRRLLDHDIQPVVILWPDEPLGTSFQNVRHLARNVPVIRGKRFRSERGQQQLQDLEIDYLISVHFPHIIPASIIEIPKIGALNLHPALLPYNRGWHTPSWAIMDGTPYGATLHWIDDGVDTGDIALQEEIDIRPDDTADSLYSRVLELELRLFEKSIPLLKSHRLPRIPQRGMGTSHNKADLEPTRRLELNERMSVGDLLRKVRGLTTNREDEAAWFEQDGDRFIVQVSIKPVAKLRLYTKAA